MDPVHVRRYHYQSQPSVNICRQGNIGVVEHGCCVEQDFKNQNGQYRWAKGSHCRNLDKNRQDDFHRMKTKPGGHVYVQVCVVDHVQPPEHGHGMKHQVLQVNDQVQGQH